MSALHLWMAAIAVIAIGLVVVYTVVHGDIKDTSGALYFLGGLYTAANIVQQYVL